MVSLVLHKARARLYNTKEIQSVNAWIPNTKLLWSAWVSRSPKWELLLAQPLKDFPLCDLVEDLIF